MGFDAAADDLVDALRVLVGANVNNALEAKYGTRPVPRTYGYPVPLEALPGVQLPALVVYRVSTTLVSTGRRNDDRRSVFAIDYFGHPTPHENLDVEWAVLHEVWEATADAVYADDFSALPVARRPDSVVANPLRAAGVQQLLEETLAANFSFAIGGQGTFPFFAGRVTLDWRPERSHLERHRGPGGSTPVLFRELLNTFRLYDADGDINIDADPIVEDLILNTGFETDPFTLGFGPPEA